MPSDHGHVLGRAAAATEADAAAAIEAAQQAAPEWAAMSFDDRAAIFLRAADLLAGPWRATLNAATMLGQGKTVQQAEIDAACELIDFWRFNVGFAREILANQPISGFRGMEPHRLPPAGRLRVRDHPVQLHRDRREPAHRTGSAGQHGALEAQPDPAARRPLHHAAARGGRAAARASSTCCPATASRCPNVALAHPDLAGIHFTGSTRTFQHLWQSRGVQHRPLPGLPPPGR